MELSKEQIIEFKALYKKQFGKDITSGEALGKAQQLIQLVKLIYKPMTKKEYEQLKKRREETRNI